MTFPIKSYDDIEIEINKTTINEKNFTVKDYSNLEN